MLQRLLATTAVAALLATATLAQGTVDPVPDTDPAMSGEAASGEGTAAGPPAGEGAAAALFVESLGAGQSLATRIAGADLHASEAPDAETAGEIQNVVIGADGAVVAVIVDTGSFLGDQSKTVAVPFDRIRWSADAGGEPRAVLAATREDLAAAPAFVVDERRAADAAPSGTPAPATDTAPGMAPGMAPETVDPAPVVPADGAGDYIATLGADQYLGADLIGDNVYAGPAETSDKIGSINDLVVASSGRIEAFVVGVGGFLGLAEKDVGVPFDAIALSRGEDNRAHAALAASKEDLMQAPAFARVAAGAAPAGTPAAATATGAATTGATATGAAATGIAAGTAAGAAAGTPAPDIAGGPVDAAAPSSPNAGPPSGQMTPMTGGDLSAEDLIGTSVLGPDSTTIGSIGDIALTPEGQVDAVIVDVGGFLGIGAKPVAVAMDNLRFMRDSAGKTVLTTQFTQDQLRGAPEYDRQTYTQDREGMRIASPGDLQSAPADPETAQ